MLHVHRAERADGLVEALRALLADPLPDPFAAEVVSVPTRGMERWLTQRMSDRLGASPGRADGICANVDFPPPRALVGDAVAAGCGIAPEDDRWLPERAVWPLLEVVDEALGEPWLRTLARHLGADGDDPARRARRFATVRHLADLYDRYALHRPGLVREWARGGDDGAAWQAGLWRRLRERVDQPDLAERLEVACARLREEPSVAGLPERLALFGLTRLPAGQLEVLGALAERRDVHLFLLHPSPALWEQVAGRVPVRLVRRAEDPSAGLPASRLLASWGQDARELQLVVAATGGAAADHHHAVAHAEGTLLARVQADVRADRRPPADPPPLDPADRSIEVHACHGRARQVEVLHDALLHLFAGDETLQPRDVIVMCPDIETFAPLVHATFGAADVDDDDEEGDGVADQARPPDLRVRLADRSLRQTNPVLGVVAQLLDLVEQRLTASQVLDLADREPVRRRFRLDDDDLARLEDWVAESGIRWGLDAAHRAPFKLDSLTAGTWSAGLDRVLVGVTMTEDEQRLVGGVLPLDDVDSGAIDLAGRVAELVDRLRAAVDALSAPATIEGWAQAIGQAADALTVTAPREAWQRAELQRILDDVVGEAGERPATLTPAEVRALLAERLRGRPTRANFRTGHLTICTLMPMRSVPHRVVCLLGLDDAMFPRRAPRDGDDLLLDDPHVGDRDPRAEDRQLLLDALLAATDRLVVTYTGNDERTNAPRPPAVPVGELLDVVDRTARTADGRPAREHVLVRHPLQPFDPRNFTAGALVADRPWSFDRVTLEGARALAADRPGPPAFLAGPLPAEDTRLLELDDLVRFVEHPVRAFLRRRLGIRVGDVSDEVADALPVELGGLDRWGVGARMLEARLAGVDRRAAYRAEIARGRLPPGMLAKRVVEAVLPIVDGIVAVAQTLDGDAPGSVDVKATLPDGRRLSGTVPGVGGDVLRTVVYSKIGPKHRLATWVRLLALTAADPERPFEALTVGRARTGAGQDATVTVARIAALGDDPVARRDEALRHLATLVDLFDRGMREPSPLCCESSAAYAHAAHHGGNPRVAAERTWTSPDWGLRREDADPEHELVHGGVLTFDDLFERPPYDDERGREWELSEPSRFGRYAIRLWEGLLACERLEDR